MAFDGTIQEISINMFGDPYEGKYVEIQQGDTDSRTIRFRLKTFKDADYAIPYNAAVALCVKRTDGRRILCDGEVEGENTVLVTLTADACICAGKQAAQLYLYSEEGDIKSQVFYLRAPEAVYRTGAQTGSGTLSQEEKDLLLALLQSAAYKDAGVLGTYNQLKTLWNSENGGTEEKTYYSVQKNLSNVTSSNSATSIEKSRTYVTTLIAKNGYEITSVKVTMGGTDVTSSTYTASSGKIMVENVTGNIVITATAVQQTQTVDVQSISLDKTVASMKVGESLTLTATVLPVNASNRSVAWTSSSSLATVSGGTVKAVSAGTVIITAKTSNGKTATCQITIAEATTTIPVQSVSFAQTSGSLEVGGNLTLTPVITPSNATDKTVTWASSKPTVASVSGGLVRALAAGSAVITATVGGKTATYTLTVAEAVTPDETLVYNLPSETTFSHSSGTYVDTGVKLFEDISTKPTWTILFDIDFGDGIQSVADTYCAFHCMEESNPWPGLSGAIWANGALGINIYGLALDGSQNTAVAGKRLKAALVLNGETASLYSNWGNKSGRTITEYSGNVSKSLILGAYQDASGNKGRYFEGTFHAFKVYKKVLDSDAIDAFIS